MQIRTAMQILLYSETTAVQGSSKNRRYFEDFLIYAVSILWSAQKLAATQWRNSALRFVSYLPRTALVRCAGPLGFHRLSNNTGTHAHVMRCGITSLKSSVLEQGFCGGRASCFLVSCWMCERMGGACCSSAAWPFLCWPRLPSLQGFLFFFLLFFFLEYLLLWLKAPASKSCGAY